MKTQEEEVLILLENGGRMPPFECRVVVPHLLAVTRHEEFSPWRVTHIPTGIAIPPDFHSVRTAITAAKRLAKRYGKRLNTTDKAKLKAVIGSYDNAVAVMKGR